MWMYLNLHIHSPADRHLGCFQLLVIINKATTINIHRQNVVWTYDLIFLGYLAVTIAGLYHKCIINCKKLPNHFFLNLKNSQFWKMDLVTYEKEQEQKRSWLLRYMTVLSQPHSWKSQPWSTFMRAIPLTWTNVLMCTFFNSSFLTCSGVCVCKQNRENVISYLWFTGYSIYV